MKAHGLGALRRHEITTLQINVGKVCNQTCAHCHVDAGPRRTESMTAEIAEACVRFLEKASLVETVDITGGAPELNPCFRFLVDEARRRGRRVIDRCNLTILFEPGQEDLAGFLAGQQVEIVASLPCYLEENVDRQRGSGVFEKSIQALQLLNGLGYGTDPELRLNLVYNPVGAALPPPQATLEAEYKSQLYARFGIVFNSLYTITNMPVQRFERFLRALGQFDTYMGRLIEAFNPEAAANVMCRSVISVGYDGLLYDCDFNQMLGMSLARQGRNLDIRDVSPEEVLGAIQTGSHCFGCTAGAGSSCTGSTVGSAVG